MKLHVLSGFLGSGKTTAIQFACSQLSKENVKAGVITNDQGIKLVDSGFFRSLNIASKQVINGCFCCNYSELDKNIQSLTQTFHPEIIFAESVGSCTDIIATVIKPLRKFHPQLQVTVSTFADVKLLYMLLKGRRLFDEPVKYIYFKQLEEADIIVVNKIDLIDKVHLQEVKEMMQRKYPVKTILYQCSLGPDNIKAWLKVINEKTASDHIRELDIDYDKYAEGEARLAWLDQELEIHSAGNTALQSARGLINNIYEKISQRKYAIGHLKFLLNNAVKISFTSTHGPAVVPGDDRPMAVATVLINARVQTKPELLSQIVMESIQHLETQDNCKVILKSVSAFVPGYPRPTHRITN